MFFDVQDDRSVYRAFMEATQNMASDIRDYSAVLCVDQAEDGSVLNGQTSFFRHYRVMRELLKSVKKPDRLRILAAPSSIGCETYSLARLCLDMGIEDCRIDAFDISPRFTALARVGAYPQDVLIRLGRDVDTIFDPARVKDLMVPVQDELRSRVRFLDAQAFENFVPQDDYDIVLIGNMFQHIKDPERVQACLDVVKETKAAFALFSRKGAPKPDNQTFVDIRAVHPRWRSKQVFDEYSHLLSYYHIWARKAAFISTPKTA